VVVEQVGLRPLLVQMALIQFFLQSRPLEEVVEQVKLLQLLVLMVVLAVVEQVLFRQIQLPLVELVILLLLIHLKEKMEEMELILDLVMALVAVEAHLKWVNPALLEEPEAVEQEQLSTRVQVMVPPVRNPLQFHFHKNLDILQVEAVETNMEHLLQIPHPLVELVEVEQESLL
jgi:hypothetical protein